jgi:hypothetical protein
MMTQEDRCLLYKVLHGVLLILIIPHERGTYVVEGNAEQIYNVNMVWSTSFFVIVGLIFLLQDR